MPTPFDSIPHTPAGHFRLHFYGAVLHLCTWIARLAEPEANAATFRNYPFLGGYLHAIQAFLPAGLPAGQAAVWWEAAIAAWQADVEGHLPLRALERLDGVGRSGRLIFMLAGLCEEDSRFGTLYRRLQEPLPARRLTLETAGRIAAGARAFKNDPVAREPAGAWEPSAGLFALGALESANPGAPRAEWMLRAPMPVWDAAQGKPPGRLRGDPARGGGAISFSPAQEFPEIEALIAPPEFLKRLEAAPELLAGGQAQVLVLRGGRGSLRREAAGAVARRLGRGLVEAAPPPPALAPVYPDGQPAEPLPESPPGYPAWLGVLCVLANAVPMLSFDLAPGETAALPDLSGGPIPVIALLGSAGGLTGREAEQALSVELPFPGPELRRRQWQRCLGRSVSTADGENGNAGRQLAYSNALEAITARFLLPGDYIRQAAALAAAEAALHGRSEVQVDDVRRATRAINRQALDNLAENLPTTGSWDYLVTGMAVTGKLHELYQRCLYREQLQGRLGPAFASNANRGVRALFSGGSGTGKTLAARILAAELGMDLYRIDLSAVVNKYIGETEKNLHQVLSRAEELDVVLLLDEGDSMLAGRTEVRSSNDRYANLETNFLLQRLEHYQGILLITTNAAQNIDGAFQRRMDVVVHFTPPQADERLAIWNLHLPEDHAIAPAMLQSAAVACDLTGGQIRNATMLAVLLAESETRQARVEARHLIAAIQAEYRKAGGVYPEIPIVNGARDHGRVAGLSNLDSGLESDNGLNHDPYQLFAGLLRGDTPP